MNWSKAVPECREPTLAELHTHLADNGCRLCVRDFRMCIRDGFVTHITVDEYTQLFPPKTS